MWGRVLDVINHAKFQLDWFRGFGAPGGRKSLSPIDWRYRPYNSVRTNVLHCDSSARFSTCHPMAKNTAAFLKVLFDYVDGGRKTAKLLQLSSTNACHLTCGVIKYADYLRLRDGDWLFEDGPDDALIARRSCQTTVVSVIVVSVARKHPVQCKCFAQNNLLICK